MRRPSAMAPEVTMRTSVPRARNLARSALSDCSHSALSVPVSGSTSRAEPILTVSRRRAAASRSLTACQLPSSARDLALGLAPTGAHGGSNSRATTSSTPCPVTAEITSGAADLGW
jgi:hypothetical protein